MVENQCELLADTLVVLLDTLTEDFDEFEMFSVLVDRSASLLEASATALLITNSRGFPRLVASHGAPGQIDVLVEIQKFDGPCLSSIETGEIVSAENLSNEISRWPEFASALLAAGYKGVHSIPLTLRGRSLGSLNLFTDNASALNDAEVTIAKTLANIFTVALIQSRALREADEMVMQLQRALSRRIATEQAKGMMAKRLGVEIKEANDLLVDFAQQFNRRPSDVALDIIDGQVPIDRIGHTAARPAV